MFKRTILLAMLIGLTVTGNAEAAYRCEGVNAQGQREVVFSDLVMPGYECSDLRKAPPPAVDPDEAMEKLREQVEALDQPQNADTVASNQQNAAEASRAEQIAQNCQIARDNLTVLQSEQDVVSTNAEGTRVLLEPVQRQQQLEQANKDIDFYCNQ